MFAGRLMLPVALLLLSAPARAELLLSVELSLARTNLGERGHSALLQLTVPLAERVAPRAIAEPAREPDPDVAPRRVARRSPRTRLEPAFVRRVVLAAHRASRRPARQRRLDGLAARARWSAALPELSVRAERSVDESLRLAPTLNDPYRYTQAGGVRTVVGGKLTWRLDRLVFAAEELAVERLRLTHGGADAKRVTRVLQLLFAWQRARLRAASPELSDLERAEAHLDALEAELSLDTLTAGWFSVHAAGR